MARLIHEEYPWFTEGSDLHELPDAPHDFRRIVVCLNVWDDLPELERSLPRWYEHVDHVIAVDGAYAGVQGEPQSTDGTLDYLAERPKVELVTRSDHWPDQPSKRTTYFERAQPGDLLWVIDADEYVDDAERIRDVPACLDVGWLRYRSQVYRRVQQQPRVFRYRRGLRYDVRHHWVMCGRKLVASHQRGGPGLAHRLLPISFFNSRGMRRPARRFAAVEQARVAQFAAEERAVAPSGVGHEPLRIVQVGPFDAGHVAQRLHTGFNATSPHHSLLCTGGTHPFKEPTQLDPIRDRATVADALFTADVVHHHVTYFGWAQFRVDLRQKVNVMHHHGTELRTHHQEYATQDAERARLRLVSNLELLQYGDDLHYLPNPVHIGRYQQLGRPRWRREALRVAHSPSKPKLKGTDALVRAVHRLQRKGLDVAVELISGVSLRESLEAKARCHAAFDSFWLGLQCSGLEAAAMGLPVVAGDPDCAREFRAWLGAVPYTYAPDEAALEAALERLATDKTYYDAERRRLGAYVLEHHDTAQVVAHYLDLLDEAVAWRDGLRLGNTLLPLRAA